MLSTGGGDLLVGGLPAELLGQEALGAGHADQGGVLVERDPYAAGLLRQGLEHGLPHPPDGVGDELDALVGVELLDRLEQAFVTDGDELGQVEPVALVLLDVGDDEPEVGRDQPFRGGLVAGQGPPGQALLFLGIRDHGELLDVEEVLIESA